MTGQRAGGENRGEGTPLASVAAQPSTDAGGCGG